LSPAQGATDTEWLNSMAMPQMSDPAPVPSPAAVVDAMSHLRRAMVDCQLRTYDVTDRTVLAAMDQVPRELFVPADVQELAYLDRPVPVGRDASGAVRYLMTPMVLARMLQNLAVKPGEIVLDYAPATGYSSAVLAAMGAIVTAVEPDPALAGAARSALAGNAATGAESTRVSLTDALPPGSSRFDAILLNGACEVEPQSLLALLSPNGRLICIMGQGRAARVMLYQRSGAAMGARMVFDAAAPMLNEFRKPTEFVF
jgi:protein-L-isoaspartate(D-aspartate) O-methyltransferase